VNLNGIPRGKGRGLFHENGNGNGNGNDFRGSGNVEKWKSLFTVNGRNKKLSYCWETVRRESMPRIAEMDVEITT